MTIQTAKDLPGSFNIATRFLDGNDPGRTALFTSAGPVSYGTIQALAAQVGHVLRELGVRRGDRVLLALGDGVESVATWYGVQKIGAVTAEAYTYLQPDEYRFFAEYARPAMVVADGFTLDRLRAAGIRDLLVVGVSQTRLHAGEHHFESLTAAAPTVLEAAPTTPDDVAMWRFTTGSTGKPKACVLAARSAALSMEWFARGVLELGPDDVVLPVPKLFFGYANNMTALFPFGVGAAGIVFPERSTPERIFELIAEHRPTILVNVPTMMSAMLAHPEAARQDLSCLRVCISAGEALPLELHRRWLETFGVEVMDGIGSSEMFHGYVCNRLGRARMGTLGQAVPGYDVRVVDEHGTPLPDGEVGRLEITGETAALEYWQDPVKSAATFVAPHTVRSADLFSRDEEGYFTFSGRADDLLKVRGKWIAPSEIENCLLTHPAVVECAVVGFERDGLTLLRAYAVRRGEVTGEALRDHVRALLSPYKRPDEVRLVDSLPQTASGKIDRLALVTVR